MSKSSRSVKEVKKRVVLPNIDHVAEDAFTPKIRIQNIVSTFNLGPRRINLKRMALAFDFIDYNPQKFAAATIRIVYPRTTALLFTSGNVVCTGGKTKLESRWAARKYVRLLQKRGMRVYLKNYKIQNIVATAFLDCAMKLREFTNDYGVYCSYEPELFPGLVFRTLKPKVVFLIFRSGKVVITGAKTRSMAAKVFKAFYHGILKNYKDDEDSNRCSSRYRKMYKEILHAPSYFTNET